MGRVAANVIAASGVAASLVLVALAPAPARAQDAPTAAPEPEPAPPAAASQEPAGDPATVEEARRHYSQGVVFFRAERFDEAIAEFEEAWALWENPTILFSLGQAYERLLRVPRALDAYRRFLAAIPADDPRRTQVEDTIRGLETILATLVVDVDVPARVIANGEDVGAAPGRIQLATGRYEIELRADGYVTHRESVTLAARTERTIHASLAPQPVVHVVDREGLDPSWFWVGVATTAAAGVATAIAGGLTLDAAARWDAAEFRTAQMREEGQRLAIITDVLGASTAVLGIATIVLAIVADWDGTERVEAGAVSFDGSRLRVRF